MTTRADVAKLAGVSESTVSYAISGKRPISESTKKRVLAAIQETGYKSNYAASALAGGLPRMVTMMTANHFLTPPSRIDGALVDGIVQGVRESGFHSVIWPIANDDDSDIEKLLELNFSGGIILMGVTKNDKRVHLLNREHVPFVVLGRTNVGFSYNYVDRDFEKVYTIALEHLAKLGHRTIGVLTGNDEVNDFLAKVGRALGLTLQPIPVSNDLGSGADLTVDFVKRFPAVTGIISLLDVATTGFMSAAKDNGLSIPKDISVVAVNMLEEHADSAYCRVSTVAFDAYGMAVASGRMIVELIEKGRENKGKKKELWVGDFMDRGSTGKARTTKLK